MRLTPFLSFVNRTFMAHRVSFDTKIVRFGRNADFSRGIFLILHRNVEILLILGGTHLRCAPPLPPRISL